MRSSTFPYLIRVCLYVIKYKIESKMKIQINPLLITGPSGVGKSTLIKRLLHDYPKNFELVISHTTRSPRVNEVNGKDYYFITKKEFERLINNEAFIEYFLVHSNYYGTSLLELKRISEKNKIPILDIDIQGALMIKKKETIFKSNFLFILPPNLEILERRLRNRGTDNENTILTRLNNAKNEIMRAENSNLYTKDDYIVNDDIEIAYKLFINRIKNIYNLN